MIDRKFYKWLFLNIIKLYVKFRDRKKTKESSNNTMTPMKEVIDLLLFKFEEKDRNEVVEKLNFTNNNPEQYLEEEDNLWVLDCTDNILQFAIVNLTGDFLDYFISDKIDELYEQIEEALPNDFPVYPNQEIWNTEEFFVWLDATLISEKTNLELVEFGTSFDDNMHMTLVNRNSTERIIELCQELEINCKKAIEMFK
jgi:hypothetical protein